MKKKLMGPISLKRGRGTALDDKKKPSKIEKQRESWTESAEAQL
jgi:hypothetical protein